MKMKALWLAVLLPVIPACQRGTSETETTEAGAAPAAAAEQVAPDAEKAAADTGAAAGEAATTPAGLPRVRLSTSLGDIVVELFPDKSPVTVENFLGYVKRKHYDGTIFHRVIDGFMIQGGGFADQDGRAVEKKTGAGIKNEAANGLRNDRGTVAMARTADPNSATAQFFINVKDNDGLNRPQPDGHGYAVFGKVVEGMEVVDKIKAVRTSTRPLTMLHPLSGAPLTQQSTDVPLAPVVIKSATVVGGS